MARSMRSLRSGQREWATDLDEIDLCVPHEMRRSLTIRVLDFFRPAAVAFNIRFRRINQPSVVRSPSLKRKGNSKRFCVTRYTSPVATSPILYYRWSSEKQRYKVRRVAADGPYLIIFDANQVLHQPQQNCEFASFDLPGLLVLRRVAAPGLDRDAFQLVDLVDIHICIFGERAIKPAKQRLSR